MDKETQRPVALITGAATGIGRACCERFAKEGFDIVISYHQPDESEAKQTSEIVKKAGATAHLIACDISSDADVKSMISSIHNHFSRLDVIVNCAGMTFFVDFDDLEAMDDDKWNKTLAVNTMGPFYIMRAAKKLLMQSPSAAIVNISSTAGVYGVGSSIAYVASKGALNSMSKAFARSFAPHIRVNAVCPGAVDSRWLRKSMSEEALKDYASNYPIPRISQPEDIADTVYYLACGTKMTTGQILVVDGGGRSI